MQISSPAFPQNGVIPQKYTCEGEGVQPPLRITDVPDETQALAMIVDDPDAPMGLFTHWLVWNIEPDMTDIEEDMTWEGALEGTNSAGTLGWVAPCPPADTGIHHYRFQLFALTSPLDLREGASRDEVEKAIEESEIGRAELIGEYRNSSEVEAFNPTSLE